MADEKELINQDEIEQLLQQQQQQSSKPAPSDDASAEPAPTESSPESSPESSLSQDDIEALLNQVDSGGGSSTAEEPADDSSPTKSSGQGLQQQEIDSLLNPGGAGASSEASPAPPQGGAPGGGRSAERSAGQEQEMGPRDVEYLLNQAQRALDSIDSGPRPDDPAGLAPFKFEEFLGEPASTDHASLDLISDVELDVKIELGRTDMYLEDVLKLRKGSVVPLDKLAGDPVDIYVNERLIARGEVLVLNDNFCVRVGELIAGSNVGG